MCARCTGSVTPKIQVARASVVAAAGSIVVPRKIARGGQTGRAERCWTACRVNQSRKSMTAPSRRSRKPANWPKAGEVTLLYTSCQL